MIIILVSGDGYGIVVPVFVIEQGTKGGRGFGDRAIGIVQGWQFETLCGIAVGIWV